MSVRETLLSLILPDVQDCRAKAAALRVANPRLSNEELADRAVRSAKRMGVAYGAGSGVFGNPVAMIPAATAEVGLLLRTEARMAGVVAALLDPDSLSDSDTFSSDVLTIIFPGAVSQVLRDAGVVAGQQTTKVLIRKYVSKDVLRAIVRFAAKWLGLKVTQKAILTKAVPLVGGVIGGAWNWMEVKAVGRRAINYHSGRSL